MFFARNIPDAGFILPFCIKSTHNSAVIRKAVDILEELWVDFMQNGKINPASGIFLAKNMFQYKDVQDVVISPNNNQDQERSVDDIKKWLSDGNTVEGDCIVIGEDGEVE